MPFLRYLLNRPLFAVKYVFTRKCECGTVRTLDEWRMFHAIYALSVCVHRPSN